MGSLKKYSGLTTKVKAMGSKLIREDEYLKIMEFDTIPEIAEYLRDRGGFEKVLEYEDISEIHRETLEHAIVYSAYNDFEKMYKFANIDQRKYLKLHFVSYEVELIKKAIRKSNDSYITKEQNQILQDIFSKYSAVNFQEVFQSQDLGGIVNALQGSIYYEPLKLLESSGNTTAFDYELALDMVHFRYIWKKRRLHFKGSELKVVTDCIGSQVDVLNLMWIYRAKKFYKMTQTEIATMIIPVYYRVKKNHIYNLIEISDLNELADAICKTFYGKYLTPDIFKNLEMDRVCKKLITKVYNKYYRTEPYSIGIMSGYLRAKREEMRRLISIVECIRYEYPKDAIMKEIL